MEKLDSGSDTAAHLSARLAPAFAANYGFTFAATALQLMFAAVLARILGHTDYGAYAAAVGLVRFLQYVADLGIATTVARRGTSLARDSIAALYAAGLGANAMLAAVVWFAAPGAASRVGLEGADAIALLRFVAFAPLVGAAGQISLALLRHDLRFATIGRQSLVALVVGQGGVAVPLALAGAGSWSLAAGLVVQAILASVLAFRAAPHRAMPLGANGKTLRDLRETLWFWLLRILDSAGFQLLAPLVAVYAGAAEAGLWDRAAILSLLPLELIAVGAGQVLFPAYARLGNDLATVQRYWITALVCVTTIQISIAAGLVIAAQDVATLVLGNAWREAADCLAVLALWAVLRGAGVVNGGLCEALGRFRIKALGQIGFLALLAIGLHAVRPTTAVQFATLVVMADVPFQILALVLATRASASRFVSIGYAVLCVGAAAGFTTGVIFAVFGLVSDSGKSPLFCVLTTACFGFASLFAVLTFHPHAETRTRLRSLIAFYRPIR